jgi:HAD superfamily hydrolase (TIGR01509 family)
VKGIIFDLDGVLIDSMPAHYKAWQIAFKEVSDIDVDERTIYLLEGMRGIDLVKKVFELKNYYSGNNNSKQQTADQASQRKNEIFRDILQSSPPRAYEGVRDLIMNLYDNCKKAVVSGSTREDVETILDKNFGKDLFNVIITADDIKKGKPDPSSFLVALHRMNLRKSEAIVVENAPLGVQAANNAGIQCIVVLNNTTLRISDFESMISEERIFKGTESAKNLLQNWCK